MALEETLDEFEEEFKGFLDELEEDVRDGERDADPEEVVATQNRLLELLYDAVTYAHQSDYPSHFSSEIKKVNQIVDEFRDERGT